MTDAAAPQTASPERAQLTASGQPRLSTRAFLRELADEVFSLDRGLPWTLGQLLRRPGVAIRRYVVQRDSRLTRPIRCLLIALALAALASQWSGAGDAIVSGLNSAPASDPAANSRNLAAMQTALGWFVRHFDLMLIVSWIPATTAALRRCYPASELNLAESFTFGAYSLSLLLWLQLPALLELLPEPAIVAWLLAAPLWSLIGSAHGYFREDGHGAGRALLFAGASLAAMLVLMLGALMFAVLAVQLRG